MISDLIKEKPKTIINIFLSLKFSELETLRSALDVALIEVRRLELIKVKDMLLSLDCHQSLTIEEKAEVFGVFISRMQSEQQSSLISNQKPVVLDHQPIEPRVQVQVPSPAPRFGSISIREGTTKSEKKRVEALKLKYPRGFLADPSVKTSCRVIMSNSCNASKDVKLSRIYINYLITTIPDIDIFGLGDKVLTYFDRFRTQSFYAVKSELKHGALTPVTASPISTAFKAKHGYLIKQVEPEAPKENTQRVTSLSDLSTLPIATISHKKAELNRQLREEDFVDEELLAELDGQSKYITKG